MTPSRSGKRFPPLSPGIFSAYTVRVLLFEENLVINNVQSLLRRSCVGVHFCPVTHSAFYEAAILGQIKISPHPLKLYRQPERRSVVIRGWSRREQAIYAFIEKIYWEKYSTGTFPRLRSCNARRTALTLLSPSVNAMTEPIIIPQTPPSTMPPTKSRLRKNVIVDHLL